MKVRITADGSGLLAGRPYPEKGDVVELPEGLAVSLIGDKRAEAVAVKAADARETASVEVPAKRGPGRPRKAA